jgi:hypothetical protein
MDHSISPTRKIADLVKGIYRGLLQADWIGIFAIISFVGFAGMFYEVQRGWRVKEPALACGSAGA